MAMDVGLVAVPGLVEVVNGLGFGEPFWEPPVNLPWLQPVVERNLQCKNKGTYLKIKKGKID